MSKRMTVKLEDYIDVINASMEHTIIGRYTDDDGELHIETLLSNDLFKEYLDSYYWERSYPVKVVEDDVDTSVITSFNAKWNAYLEENSHNFDRIAEALYTDYNPLYNYNKMQHTVNIRTGSETDNRTLNKGAETEGLTKSGSENHNRQYGAAEHNRTESGQITDQHSVGQRETTSDVATMDTNTYQPTGRVSEAAAVDTDTRSYTAHNIKETAATRTDTEAITYNNYQEQRNSSARQDTDNNTKTYNSVKDDFTDDTKGNIGVMESVTMIESELRLRKRQIGLELMAEFINLWTYRV